MASETHAKKCGCGENADSWFPRSRFLPSVTVPELPDLVSLLVRASARSLRLSGVHWAHIQTLTRARAVTTHGLSSLEKRFGSHTEITLIRVTSRLRWSALPRPCGARYRPRRRAARARARGAAARRALSGTCARAVRAAAVGIAGAGHGGLSEGFLGVGRLWKVVLDRW